MSTAPAPHPPAEIELLALALLGASLAPSRWLHTGPTTCPFRLATGRPCPACGLTRSWNATARLQLRRAVRMHLFGPPTFVLAAWVVFTGSGRRAASGWLTTPLPLAAAVAWLSWWIYRLRRT